MASYTVEITQTGNNFNFDPGYLQVQHGDKVRFTCNQPFTVKFLDGTPFAKASQFAKNAPATTAYSTIDAAAALRPYHYAVSATDADGFIHMDAGCPTIEVV